MNLDVGQLGQFVGLCFDREVLAALERAGFAEVCSSHGYVVQRLLEGPHSVSALARQLGVTQQAVSKQVAEMTALGLVEPAAPGTDARERRVQLSKRGHACVARSRQTRKKVSRRLEAALGVKALADLERTLTRALTALGGMDAVQRRRVRPPR